MKKVLIRVLQHRLISSGKGTYEQEFGPNHTILNIYLPFAKPVSEPRYKTLTEN